MHIYDKLSACLEGGDFIVIILLKVEYVFLCTVVNFTCSKGQICVLFVTVEWDALVWCFVFLF